MDFKPVHSKKAEFPMLVTLLGIVIEVKLEQLEKVLSPMLVRPSPMNTEVRPEHELKAEFPMLITLLGIVIEVKPEQ